MLAEREVGMHVPEDHLVARCRAGDLDAFGEVYARYERRVFRYAYHFLGNADDASDIKQETFLRAFQRFATYNGKACLATWLLTVCANLCRDRLKSRAHRSEVLVDPTLETSFGEPATEHGDPVRVMEREETARVVQKALAGLPDGYREIIVLRDIEELPVEEVARILGCSRVNVNVKLYRARQRLRERLEALLSTR